jgi:hypothetical protein
MFVIPTLSRRRAANHRVYDWSRSTHNRSIGAADADLSAAAKLATDSAFGAKRTAAASSDRSLLVTTTARPYGVTRQIAKAATGQDHAHKRYCRGLRTSAHRTSDIDNQVGHRAADVGALAQLRLAPPPTLISLEQAIVA